LGRAKATGPEFQVVAAADLRLARTSSQYDYCHRHRYDNIVDLPIKNCDFPYFSIAKC
jgi:hypothetical protein